MKKRIISLIVAVILCVAMIVPASVNADVDENLPYFEKLITVEGDTVTLTVTLRGPDKSCAGGQVDIAYPAEKLTYQCPGVNPDNTEMWDEDLPWLGIGYGNINGHTDPGMFFTNFFGARATKTNQVLCEVTFKINEGYTVNASDFTVATDIVSDGVGQLVENYAPITFVCKHTEYKADPESTVAPTCNTAGKTVEKCVSCGDAKETEIPATGVHTFEVDETKSIPATETTDGINYLVCTGCGETKTEKVEKTGVVDAKPYHEKVFKVTGDKVYLTVTLRGPKAVCGGEFYIDYNADKLEYVCPGVDEEGFELYDNEDWLISKGGSVNGLKQPGKVFVSYFAARPYNSGSVVIVIEFNIKDGAKIEESDLVPTHDATFGTDGFENNIPSAPVYIFCEHTNYVENTEESVAPTCENAGTKVYYCDSCGDKKVEEVPALGHELTTVTVDATCDVAGSATTTCSRCDYENVATIPALGHTEVVDAAVAATCTEAGLTEGKHCSVCDKVLVAQEVVPALGHDEVKATVDATCTEAGSVTTTCSRCDYKVVETIEALGHDYKTETVKATCETAGSITTTCSRCDYKNVETIEATGHSFSDPVVTKEATCTEAGVMTGTCTACGQTTTEEIPAKGHSFADPVVTKPATCTVAGVMTGTCTACDETTTEEIPALGHDYVTTTVDPTCTTEGTTTATCSRCDYRDVVTAPALGHTEVVDAAVAATCTESGLTEGKHCSVCGEVLVAQEVVTALGHDEVKTTVDPTCTEAGSVTTTCSRCDYKVVETIEALGHDEVKTTVDATCTEAGSVTTTCSRCDYENVEVIPATGHSIADPVVTKEATCTEAGAMTGTCTACDETVTEEIPALGHKYDEGKITKEPTETEEGEKTFKCERCDEVKVEKIAKLDTKPEDKPEDKPVVEDKPEVDDTTKAPAGNATGDSAQLLLVSFIALISLAVLATIVFRNKARN